LKHNYINLKGILVLTVLLIFSIQDAKAQFWKDDTASTKKEGIFVMPLIYYTPDTRFAAGAMGVYYFHTGNNDSLLYNTTRLSYIKLLADYTQNKQLDIWSSWNIFTNEERFLFKGELRYRNFPDRYYGVGNTTSKEDEEYYSYDLLGFKLLALRKVRNGLFIGLDYQFTKEYNFKYFENKELINGTVPGYNGGIGSAMGFVAVHDTRDNVVNAYSGELFEVSSYFNTHYLGSTFDFTNINVTFNKYFEIKKDHVIATNTVINMNYGVVPFLDMAKVGGDDILRGYAKNRYRDHHFAGTQVEYRFPLFWRLGMVTFAGIGDVFRTTKDLTLNNLKYTYGAGLRFRVNTKERLNVRFDYGFGRKHNSFYITLTEAF
jgi:hypothetical protein